jgi:transposase InsO family protein
MGLGRLKHLQPPVPVRRYQWARPGDMIHVDSKQLARFNRVSHRITGDRRLGRSADAGYEKAHVAIDDATRLAYAEVLPDEKQATTGGFLIRTVAWFSRQGIEYRRVLSDNGSAYRSKPRRQAGEALELTAKRTRPYTPGTNGKAERYGLRPTPSTSRPW